MATSVPAPGYRESERTIAETITGGLQRWQAWFPLLAVTALALLVNAWGISHAGYGNTYYAAATRAMTQSWSNFFFGAFDPAGFISVDKPPVFLWIDAVSARVFGYSSLALLMPSAVAGALSVALLWLILRRYFGVAAATIAALVLALTPISVAVHRLNLPEPFLLLALIGAAGCILRSLEPGRWLWWTIAAGLLVGVAFNTKMLVGWIPGPALAIALVIGLRGGLLAWQEWIPRLAVFGTVALIVSASWMVAVDTWPASERPYVGGSLDNTVYDLTLGYNGIGRVDPEDDDPRRPLLNAARFGPGGIIAGQPDVLRMFDAANGGQIAWFLPFALLGGFVSLWRWREDRILRAAVVLWLGWTLLFAGVFSYAQGIYHAYYTAALAPGIAALVGMSSVALVGLIQRHRAWLAAAAGIVCVTLYTQLVVSGRFEDFFEWATPVSMVAVTAGLGLMAVAVWRPHRLPAMAGIGVVLAGLLLTPAAWSGYEVAHPSTNSTLPQAGPRNNALASRSFGSEAFDAGNLELANWLQRNRDEDLRWDLAVPGAQNASTLMAEYGFSIMAIGGFSGADPTMTPAEFGEYVASGDVRYVLAPGRPPGIVAGAMGRAGRPNLANVAGAGAVMAMVETACEPIGRATLAGRSRATLYDCAGRGSALGAGQDLPAP